MLGWLILFVLMMVPGSIATVTRNPAPVAIQIASVPLRFTVCNRFVGPGQHEAGPGKEVPRMPVRRTKDLPLRVVLGFLRRR